jgi:hypothetical protein
MFASEESVILAMGGVETMMGQFQRIDETCDPLLARNESHAAQVADRSRTDRSCRQ